MGPRQSHLNFRVCSMLVRIISTLLSSGWAQELINSFMGWFSWAPPNRCSTFHFLGPSLLRPESMGFIPPALLHSSWLTWENPRVGCCFIPSSDHSISNCKASFPPSEFQVPTGGPGHKRAEKTGMEKGMCLGLACYLWELGELFHALQARTRWLLLVRCCPCGCLIPGIRLYLVQAGGPGWLNTTRCQSHHHFGGMYLKFWLSSLISLLRFTFQRLQIAALFILSRFYSHFQWARWVECAYSISIRSTRKLETVF